MLRRGAKLLGLELDGLQEVCEELLLFQVAYVTRPQRRKLLLDQSTVALGPSEKIVDALRHAGIVPQVRAVLATLGNQNPQTP